MPGRQCDKAAIKLLAGALCVAYSAAVSAQRSGAQDLADLSLEELANVEVSSVSRRAERLSDAPASIYVITGEDIRRAGVTTLPEALRLAPNLQVARIDASQYAISARGFNNSIGNKLLVLIDGRTVYTPLFSGVFWDQQDVMLEDVERIEVISGPGATLWGSNAVNGVINVITRSAADTQGVLAVAGVGNRERGAAFRYGGALDGGGHFRVYGKASDVQNTRRGPAFAVTDEREFFQTGFRMDRRADSGLVTVQGDVYEGRTRDRGVLGPFVLDNVLVSGFNLLGRWSRALEGGSEARVQMYLDHSERTDVVLFQPKADIFDIEAQHALTLGAHKLLYGGGYRHGQDNVQDALLTGLRPQRTNMDWANVFVQGEVRLTDDLTSTAGLKLERNDYTGWEMLPGVRLAWQPAPRQLLWGSASRAVRAPSRFDREVVTPIAPGATVGGPDFRSEVAWVFELGNRGQPARNLNYSWTLFRHEWDRLRSGTPPPLVLENGIEGSVSGLEAWGGWQVMPSWLLRGGFVHLRKNLRVNPESNDPVGVDNVTLGNDPELQWTLRSSHEIGRSHHLELALRHVRELPVPKVEDYTVLDLSYLWRVNRALELSLAVQNLNDRRHEEFRTSAQPANEVERSVFLRLRWTP